MKQELLFVLGAPKTCTSTIIGILNLHPDIFIMAEACPRKNIKHIAKIYEYYGFKKSEMIENHKSITHSYTKLYDLLIKKSKERYTYFGDKWAQLDSFKNMSQTINEMKDHKLIFTIRDIRTWLPHKTVQKKCANNGDNIFDAVVKYTYYFVKSFEHPTCIKIKLEDFISDHNMTLNKIDRYLDRINLLSYTEEWWNKLGKYNDKNKNIHKWWIGRDSSVAKPERLDIYTEIQSNVLWDNILPIFDKYFNNIDQKFDQSEIEQDLFYIENFYNKKLIVSLKDCYKNIEISPIIKYDK